jgi:vesicle-associated membrane protein 7
MRFIKNYGRVARSALAYAMNDEFSRVLHQQMEFFSSNPSADTLNRLRGEVSEASTCFIRLIFLEKNILSFQHPFCVQLQLLQIHTVMVDNIDKILDRGDRISLLVDKTSTMQDSAFHFRKQSKSLRRALWMKNVKLL